MNSTELIDRLEQQGAWTTDRQPDKKWLKEYILDMLSEYFEMYYQESPSRYWNESHTALLDPINVPDAYIDFLWHAKSESAQLGGPYGMTIFCWTTMLYRTIDWMNVHERLADAGPRYWINMAERGDKGFIYMCCDTKSKFYGKVLEFYDDSPWNGNDNMPGEEEDCRNCETFEEFLQTVIKDFGKKAE